LIKKSKNDSNHSQPKRASLAQAEEALKGRPRPGYAPEVAVSPVRATLSD